MLSSSKDPAICPMCRQKINSQGYCGLCGYPEHHIYVGTDEEPHHVDGQYVAFLSWNFCREARGFSRQEAVQNLIAAYPEAVGLPVRGLRTKDISDG